MNGHQESKCLTAKERANEKSRLYSLLSAAVEYDRSYQHPLNQSNNVLLIYRLQNMRSVASLNFGLAIMCLTYCGINIALIFVNYLNAKAESNGSEQIVSDDIFHRLEFWATFGFALIECISLVATPKSLISIYKSPLTLKLVLFFNIVASFVPALLVTLNRETFEILSHEIEYINELTKTFVDLILLFNLLQLEDESIKGHFFLTIGAGVVACVQLAVYNLLGKEEDGDMIGEVPAHYFEFVFEMLSSFIGFWFCMDNKRVAEHEIGLILYGSHDNCGICGESREEFEQTYQVSSAKKANYVCPATSYGSVSKV